MVPFGGKPNRIFYLSVGGIAHVLIGQMLNLPLPAMHSPKL